MISVAQSDNLWDKYWGKYPYKDVSLDQVIKKDAIYRLLKKLVGFSQRAHSKVKLLENGCGPSIRSLALVKDFSQIEFEITFVDISFVALAVAKRIARENNVSNVRCFNADVLSLPFPDNQFDLVWNEGVNEHMKEKDRLKVFWEMYRVTKKGGKIVVIVPNRLNFAYLMHKKLRELRQEWQYGYENPFTIFELKNIMKAVNLKEVEVCGTNVIDGYLWLINYLITIFFKRKAYLTQNTSSNIKKSIKSIIKKNIERINLYAEKIEGSVLGRDIGISGIK